MSQEPLLPEDPIGEGCPGHRRIWMIVAIVGAIGSLFLVVTVFDDLPRSWRWSAVGWCLLLCLVLVAAALLMGVFRERPAHPLQVIAVLRASAALREGRPKDALAIIETLPPYEAGSRRSREDAVLHFHRGVCLMYLGRLDEAKEVFESLLEADQDLLPTATAVTMLASVNLLLGNVERAGALLEALRDIVKNRVVWAQSGTIALEQGRPQEADGFFARTLVLDPDDRIALAGRALAAMEQEGATEVAREWIHRAKAADDNDPAVLLAEARWAQLSGDEEQARLLFNRALTRLEDLGVSGFAPLYVRRAQRWGIPSGWVEEPPAPNGVVD